MVWRNLTWLGERDERRHPQRRREDPAGRPPARPSSPAARFLPLPQLGGRTAPRYLPQRGRTRAPRRRRSLGGAQRQAAELTSAAAERPLASAALPFPPAAPCRALQQRSTLGGGGAGAWRAPVRRGGDPRGESAALRRHLELRRGARVIAPWAALACRTFKDVVSSSLTMRAA